MRVRPWREIKHKSGPPGWIECHALVSLAKSQPRLHSMSLRCQRHEPHKIHSGWYMEPEGATVTITWIESL